MSTMQQLTQCKLDIQILKQERNVALINELCMDNCDHVKFRKHKILQTLLQDPEMTCRLLKEKEQI